MNKTEVKCAIVYRAQPIMQQMRSIFKGQLLQTVNISLVIMLLFSDLI